MDRALPAWAIDVIRDGVAPAELKKRGDRAVWSALVRTAASAHQRGQSVMEWEAQITDPRSRLGVQVTLKDGHRARKPLTVAKTIADAWDAAVVWCSEQDKPWGSEEVRAAAEARAVLIRDLVADPDAELTDAERAVLAYAAEQTAKRGMTRIALPRRDLLEATGLGLTALRTTLKRLHDNGLLVLVEAGRSGGPSAQKRRANLYGLPEAVPHYLSRGTRPVVPPTQTCGAPAVSGVGAPSQVCGAPDSTLMENNMVTLTLTSADPEALAAAIAALARAGEVSVDQSTSSEVLPDNVRRLRAS